MADLHETEVDGVRCFWVDSGRPTLNASILFRAGLVDETFSTHGWHHLIEHSALHGRGGGALTVNGSVALTTTTFDCHGPIDLVSRHLADVTAWLAAPEFSDIERETRILMAEQRTRPWSPTADALVWRYGARGPGLAATDEYGLTRATPEGLTELASRTFHQGNAVLVLDGPPPVGLHLALATDTGTGLSAIPPAVPCESLYPLRYNTNGLVISGTVERSSAATMLPSVLETRIRKEFRDRAGASYAPWSVYEGVDADTAVVFAGTDVNDEFAGQSALRAVEIVDRAAEFGAEAQDLVDLVSQIVQAMRDPYASANFAWRAGHRALGGHPPETSAEVIASVESLTADDIAEVASQLRNTLMVGATDKTVTPSSLTEIARPAAPQVEGARFRSQDWPADASILTVSSTHITAVGTGERVGVAYDDLVGVIKHPTGLRILVANDSWNLTVDPTMWTNGDRAVAVVDQHVPDHLVVSTFPDDRYTPHERMPWRRRWWHGTLKVLGARNGTVFAFAIMALLGSGLIASGIAAGIGALSVVGAIFIGRGIYDFAKNEVPEDAPTEVGDLRRFRDSNR